MPKLSIALATTALEAAGYEQASNVPGSFVKVIGPVTIVCRVRQDDDEPITGHYTALTEYVGLTFIERLSLPLMLEGDASRANKLIFNSLLDRVTKSRDNIRDTWETQDKLHLNLQALLTLDARKN